MKNKYPKKSTPQNDGFPPVSSSTDFTGLIPAGLNSRDELEAYNEMYAFIPPSDINTKNTSNTTK